MDERGLKTCVLTAGKVGTIILDCGLFVCMFSPVLMGLAIIINGPWFVSSAPVFLFCSFFFVAHILIFQCTNQGYHVAVSLGFHVLRFLMRSRSVSSASHQHLPCAPDYIKNSQPNTNWYPSSALSKAPFQTYKHDPRDLLHRTNYVCNRLNSFFPPSLFHPYGLTHSYDTFFLLSVKGQQNSVYSVSTKRDSSHLTTRYKPSQSTSSSAAKTKPTRTPPPPGSCGSFSSSQNRRVYQKQETYQVRSQKRNERKRKNQRDMIHYMQSDLSTPQSNQATALPGSFQRNPSSFASHLLETAPMLPLVI